MLMATLLPAAELNEQLLDAVRHGDAPQVKALLENGADANAKYRYDRTILSFAAARENVDIVRLLLDRGADPEAQDSYYRATPLDMAADKLEIRLLLIERMKPESVGPALVRAAAEGRREIVEAVLSKPGLPGISLNAALARALAAKRTEVAALLKKAGAVEPPKAGFRVPEATLRGYVGKYKSESGEVEFTFNEGRLSVIVPGQRPLVLNAIDATTFRPGEMFEISVTFGGEGAAAAAVAIVQGGRTTNYRRLP